MRDAPVGRPQLGSAVGGVRFSQTALPLLRPKQPCSPAARAWGNEEVLSQKHQRSGFQRAASDRRRVGSAFMTLSSLCGR
jgi:hypothetical protein